MNSNELMKDLNRVLKESGWLDKATEFYQNHPEYFHKGKYDGYISSLGLSVSYQPKSLSDIATITPCIFINMGGTISEFAREYNMHNTGRIYSRTWINGMLVTEVKCEET